MIYRIYRVRPSSPQGEEPVGAVANAQATGSPGKVLPSFKGLTIFDREVGDAYDPAKEYTPPDGRGPVLSALPRAVVTVERNVVPFGLAPV